jgi:hypothetical protein
MHSTCGDAPNCLQHLNNTKIARNRFECIGDQQSVDFGALGGCMVA